jgi:hypothetical protein
MHGQPEFWHVDERSAGLNEAGDQKHCHVAGW